MCQATAYLARDGQERLEEVMFDVVVAKVDAPDELLYQQINRPFVDYALAEVLWGIRRFWEEFQGKLALQMMFEVVFLDEEETRRRRPQQEAERR